MTSEEYVARGGLCCPVCGSTNVDGGHMTAEYTSAWAEVTCLDCESEWRDVYTMAGYEDLKEKVRA